MSNKRRAAMATFEWQRVCVVAAAIAVGLSAVPAAAEATPLTARSFTHRQGKVAVISGAGGLQSRALALRSGASAIATIPGPTDSVDARMRLGGARCHGASTTALIDGRRSAKAPKLTTRWRSYALPVVESPSRHSLRLRFRAGTHCRLLFDQGALHTAAPDVPASGPIALGTAVDWGKVATIPGYGALALKDFAYVTPENEMKMNVLQPKRGMFDFSTADALVAWSLANGKQIHGHALIFGQQLPAWLTDPSLLEKLEGQGHFDKATLEQILRDHVTTVMRHFAPSVHEWDVVNEALLPDGSYRSNIWLDTIGPDYVEQAFRAARAADPSAKLCYNEIGDEVAGPEADAVFALAARLKAEGLIDCLGFETHLNAVGPPSEVLMEQNLGRFATLGLDLHVSELDVDVSRLAGDSASKYAAQAAVYADAALACSHVAACTRFTTWGMTDASTWLGPDAQPLPFDSQLAPKPAWAAMLGGLGARAAPGARAITEVPPVR